MAQDWDAVARAVTTRAAELQLTQRQLAKRSGLGVVTIRAVQNNYPDRRIRDRTLSALSQALDWPAHHLDDVLTGAPIRTNQPPEQAPIPASEPTPPETSGTDVQVLEALNRLQGAVDDIRERLERIELAIDTRLRAE